MPFLACFAGACAHLDTGHCSGLACRLAVAILDGAALACAALVRAQAFLLRGRLRTGALRHTVHLGACGANSYSRLNIWHFSLLLRALPSMHSPCESLRVLENEIKDSEVVLGHAAVQALLARTGELYVQILGSAMTGRCESAYRSLELVREDFERRKEQATTASAA